MTHYLTALVTLLAVLTFFWTTLRVATENRGRRPPPLAGLKSLTAISAFR